jgi:hypothetical protein
MQCSPISYWPKASLCTALLSQIGRLEPVPLLAMGLRYRDLFEVLREHSGGKT